MDLEKNKTNEKRLKILSEEEVKIIYDRPCFTYEERCYYFTLSQPEKELLDTLRSIKSQAYFILQLGYFKFKHLFYTFDLHEVEEDLRYILKEHFNGTEIIDMSSIGKVTRLKQQGLILPLFNFRSCGPEERQEIGKKAHKAATFCGKPIYIFREIMNYLSENRITVPGYSFMQEIVGQAITHEQNRLVTLVQNHLKQVDKEALERLLEDSSGLYEITLLKREPRDFSATEIKREMDRGKQIQPLYHLAQELLPGLGISNESIKYYASLVSYYSVYKLKRLNEWIVYVYLLCFVYHRYQRMHDNLINTFLFSVQRYTDEAKQKAKERVYDCYTESNQNMGKAGEVLKLFTDEDIPPHTPFQDIRERAFAILERQKLASIANQITTDVTFDETAFQWEHIDQIFQKFKRFLRPIFMQIDFAPSSPNDPLMDAINFLKAAFMKNKALGQYHPDDLPNRFMSKSVKRYMYQQKSLVVDRYEFLIYRLLRKRLEAGDIFSRDSIRFRSFEDDLIDDQKWQQKEKLIDDFGLTIFQQPIQNHLFDLEKQLEARLIEVNQNISSGKNEHLQIKKRGPHTHWTLPYNRDTEPINHAFYDTLKQMDIRSILYFAHEHCRFLDAFEHILGRYTKQTKDNRTLIACLIAWGTNMGLGRMGEISDINYSTLAATSDNFIRLETLKEANDRTSNATAKLPIFKHYNIDESLHSSSDGQKKETRIHTINSRHSPKYFGLGKGIVSYNMVANHVPVNARIIGANEHESHYVFDILYNNTTDIQPDIHSTDTHGTNEVNFAILHFFGYQFAPRYKDFHDKVGSSLYGFKHPSQYGDMLIKPVRKLNTKLIMEEWEIFSVLCYPLR